MYQKDKKHIIIKLQNHKESRFPMSRSCGAGEIIDARVSNFCILTVVSLSLDGLRSRSFSLEFGGGGLNFEDDSLG